MRKLLLHLAAGCIGLGITAHATVINFNDLNMTDYSSIPDGYGSIAGVVDVSYRTLNNDAGFTEYSPHMELWNTGYGDFFRNAFQIADGKFGEIVFTPHAGYSITLNGFDMAAYITGAGSRTESVIDIIYGSTIQSFGPAQITRTTHDNFAPAGVTSSGPIKIRFGTDWNVGIDNIDFTASAVPEPSTYLAGALLVLPFGVQGIRYLRTCKRVS